MIESEIPKGMKLVMVFIDRVGFPTMAFLLMSYVCFVTLTKITSTLTELTNTMMLMSAEFKSHDVYSRRALRSLGADDD